MKASLSSELKEPALGRSGWKSVPGRGSSKHEVPEVETSWGMFKELTNMGQRRACRSHKSFESQGQELRFGSKFNRMPVECFKQGCDVI